MKGKRLLEIFLVLTFILSVFVYTLKIGGSYNDTLKDFIYLLPPFLSIVAGFSLVKFYGPKNKHGLAMLFITIGIACFFAGEFLWVLLENLQMDPYPSIADFFYLIAYPFFLLGFFKEIKTSKLQWDQKTRRIFYAILAVILLTILYLSFYFFFDPEVSLLENIISISYNFGDSLLVISSILIILVILEYRGGRIISGWLFILVSFLVMVVADILFIIYTSEYEEGIFIYRQMDLLWILSYLLMAYGIFKIKFTLKGLESRLSKKA